MKYASGFLAIVALLFAFFFSNSVTLYYKEILCVLLVAASLSFLKEGLGKVNQIIIFLTVVLGAHIVLSEPSTSQGIAAAVFMATMFITSFPKVRETIALREAQWQT